MMSNILQMKMSSYAITYIILNYNHAIHFLCSCRPHRQGVSFPSRMLPDQTGSQEEQLHPLLDGCIWLQFNDLSIRYTRDIMYIKAIFVLIVFLVTSVDLYRMLIYWHTYTYYVYKYIKIFRHNYHLLLHQYQLIICCLGWAKS